MPRRPKKGSATFSLGGCVRARDRAVDCDYQCVVVFAVASDNQATVTSLLVNPALAALNIIKNIEKSPCVCETLEHET